MSYDPRKNTIDGWMSPDELVWLYNLSTRYRTILELGSWKGRSTHALLSGGAHVTAVDTWLGADSDETQARAQQEDIFALFMHNVAGFTNLTVNRQSSLVAMAEYPDSAFDVVFIDANHADAMADILAWQSKATHILCGHDYGGGWETVTRAVDALFGKPDGVLDSIWWVDMGAFLSRSPNFA